MSYAPVWDTPLDRHAALTKAAGRAERAAHGPGARAVALDRAAFEVFYNRTERPLRAYLHRLTGSSSLADDLAHDAYFRLLRSAPPTADPARLRAYLFRVATNLYRDHYRRVGRREAELVEPDAEIAAQPDGAVRTDMNQALGRLRPRQRALLWLTYVEGLTHREVAAVLGLRPISVGPLLWRARRSLARVLRAQGLELKP